VQLDVYDVAGRHVRTLVRRTVTVGEHRVTWNGRDDAGRAVASGVYLVRLRGDDFVQTQRVSLLK
jgi:flagellar hook assembly protein FlgD